MATKLSQAARQLLEQVGCRRWRISGASEREALGPGADHFARESSRPVATLARAYGGLVAISACACWFWTIQAAVIGQRIAIRSCTF